MRRAGEPRHRAPRPCLTNVHAAEVVLRAPVVADAKETWLTLDEPQPSQASAAVIGGLPLRSERRFVVRVGRFGRRFGGRPFDRMCGCVDVGRIVAVVDPGVGTGVEILGIRVAEYRLR
jgi:hypothetical protein